MYLVRFSSRLTLKLYSTLSFVPQNQNMKTKVIRNKFAFCLVCWISNQTDDWNLTKQISTFIFKRKPTWSLIRTRPSWIKQPVLFGLFFLNLDEQPHIILQFYPSISSKIFFSLNSHYVKADLKKKINYWNLESSKCERFSNYIIDHTVKIMDLRHNWYVNTLP